MVSDRFVKFTEAVISSTVIFGEDGIIAELEGSFPPDKMTEMCCSLLSDSLSSKTLVSIIKRKLHGGLKI